MWHEWITGQRDWDLGRIVPDEILYYLNGPAIFTCRIGLDTYLFFKSDEYEDGDYYIASSVSSRELEALKRGRLSVHGALRHENIWLFQTDFDLGVMRYEMRSESLASSFLPKAGVPLVGSFPTAADSLAQVESLFAFKFFGEELSEEGLPLTTLRGLIDKVHDVVREALTPIALSGGRDRNFIDYTVKPLEFASLLIAIDHPELDVAKLRSQRRTRNVQPEEVLRQAFERGREFADQIERTVELASFGDLPNNFGADNFQFLQQIIDILPSSDSDVSRLQFSSSSAGNEVFVEVNAAVGDRIRGSYAGVVGRDVYITGTVDGLIGASKTIRLRRDNGREVTCQLGWNQFDELAANGRISFGVRVGLQGRYIERPRRDFMKVEADPVFF
ncbi:hypothetical protein GCM10008023_29450 [Sphingomonas glacialis]|uniref:Uncharacterized protein n=1 Tax=Sphingomonas glacialis TaxID=658225 RepID=A0ABQ3LXF8_9SPHN|nr:hypothetical protein [Sphingomonas glacialis]GHH20949.1 hypothetical protein GCM10008023_29450 [Sphingomonas glacialis]